MLLSRLLVSLASFIAVATAADEEPQDLGTVLANHKNLTTYYNLIKKYPDILLQLPNYSGVTIVAPSDAAFKNIPYTSLNHVWDPTNKTTTVPLLQYMILQGTVATEAIESGPTYVKPTLLVNTNYTNVTSGQNILVVKQPEDVVVFTTSLGTRCTVIEKDIPFQGGLIQMVDNLLIPPARLRETAEAFQLTSFLGGLYAGGIMPQLANRENITIFAPKNSAIEPIAGTLTNMTVEQLSRVMAYHVVANQVLVSSDLTNGTWLPTLNPDAAGTGPESVLVRQDANNMYINAAQIVQPDILLANGIMHIISDVLNPDDTLVVPNPEIPTQPPVFALSTVSDVAFTTDIPCTVSCPVTTTAFADNSTMESTATATSTTTFSSRPSQGLAAAKPTAHMGGIALGMMGLGAGMVLL